MWLVGQFKMKHMWRVISRVDLPKAWLVKPCYTIRSSYYPLIADRILSCFSSKRSFYQKQKLQLTGCCSSSVNKTCCLPLSALHIPVWVMLSKYTVCVACRVISKLRLTAACVERDFTVVLLVLPEWLLVVANLMVAVTIEGFVSGKQESRCTSFSGILQHTSPVWAAEVCQCEFMYDSFVRFNLYNWLLSNLLKFNKCVQGSSSHLLADVFMER